MKRTLSILAAILLIAAICSCDNQKEHGGNGNDSGNVGADTDVEYVMPEINMQGETVTVLNVADFYGMYLEFVTEEGGDTLDTAIYESNMRLQEQFNFIFVEDEHPVLEWDTTYPEMGNHLVRNIKSGDDVYDFAHYPINERTDLITSGYILDLSELNEFQFDKPWWDTRLNEVICINDRQYMACGAINLMAYEAMTTIFFNKEILAINNLDDPYEMVREGTWTLDALLELAREAQTLNTDTTWDDYQNGTAVFGIAKHESYPIHFVVGAGMKGVSKEDGKYQFTLESDEFYTAASKITEIFTPAADGGIGGGTNASGVKHYVTLFSNNRALFLMSELKAGVEMRESDVQFGILPMPKYNEAQDSYYTNMIHSLHFVCIPATSENPDQVSAIIDAMAYDRYKNVVPVYYDSHIEYKGLRDEESLEMLEIMSAGRTIDAGIAYGWYGDFRANLNNAICWNEPLSSLIAENKGKINTTIEEFIDQYLS